MYLSSYMYMSIKRCLPWFIWDESETFSSFNRWSFSERRTKEGLLKHGLKLIFRRYIGQLRRLPPPHHQETPWRGFLVHKRRACEDDNYGLAKRNDKDVPQNSCRPKKGKASRSVVSLQWPYGWLGYDLCKWLSSRPNRRRINRT